ncbi:transcriptional regulator, TetR family [Nitratiruptor sp. YY08-26]|uniref:TetR/AcrR family transcriptional regulator n=1 Tax=unclassified Nitratiruptor TaxID=2624044 RepID=UPI001915F5BB|nr:MULTISPECIES: TetR/AcrR family transcriptional regulator [unclassified Nitratiruptor]BCD62119.1 transcriptional regulator, TetR family [Nitratiruptor sp. YY08-13]BCD66055.1 transcriptional regulator, TetR family [Nitratiruptor sp. YY08-26]
MDKKEIILQTALALFNNYDTKTITTNHIAKEAGVSPGNLYYHYKNKEEIIYELYKQMMQKIGFLSAPLPASLCEMNTYCRYVANVWWEYRFLRKELLFLMRRDPLLQQAVIKDNKAQYEKLLELIKHLITNGCIEKKAMQMHQFIAQTIMLYSQFWTPFLTIMGEKENEAAALRITQEIEKILQPYLTQKAITNLQQCKGV